MEKGKAIRICDGQRRESFLTKLVIKSSTHVSEGYRDPFTCHGTNKLQGGCLLDMNEW